MKQIILPVTVHLNVRPPLPLWPRAPPAPPPGRARGAHPCQGGDNGGGCGRCHHEKKQA